MREDEDGIVPGEEVLEAGGLKWLKKNAQKIRPTILAMDPALFFVKSRRARAVGVYIVEFPKTNIDLGGVRFLNGFSVGRLETDLGESAIPQRLGSKLERF